MNIEQIKECRSLKDLSSMWISHIDEVSRLPKDQALALIEAKDRRKAKLEIFEEWLYWFEERSAIGEYDGGLSCENTERQAKESISRSI